MGWFSFRFKLVLRKTGDKIISIEWQEWKEVYLYETMFNDATRSGKRMLLFDGDYFAFAVPSLAVCDVLGLFQFPYGGTH